MSTIACTSASAATPQEEVAAADIQRWMAALETAVTIRPKLHYVNPARETFLAKLHTAASQYRFTIVKVEILHPKQSAPLVVVQTSDEPGLSSSTAAILHSLNPLIRGPNGLRVGYEGFLFEVLDRKGVPCLVTFTIDRAHPQGSQWAAPPCHFPFARG